MHIVILTLRDLSLFTLIIFWMKKHDKLFYNLIPKDEISSIIYSLSSTIRNKVFNYKETISNKNTKDTETYETSISSCICANLKYLNHHHGHIITEDLRITKIQKFVRL